MFSNLMCMLTQCSNNLIYFIPLPTRVIGVTKIDLHNCTVLWLQQRYSSAYFLLSLSDPLSPVMFVAS